MNSPLTGKEMIMSYRDEDIKYKGITFKYNHLSWFCSESNEYFTTTELDTINLKNIKDEYRKIEYLSRTKE